MTIVAERAGETFMPNLKSIKRVCQTKKNQYPYIYIFHISTFEFSTICILFYMQHPCKAISTRNENENDRNVARSAQPLA